jgi:AmiR/NasT family two-component response regulator
VPTGSQQLLTGITAAFQIRDLIQQALGVIMARQQVTAQTAYLILRTTAADTGATMLETATAAQRQQEA